MRAYQVHILFDVLAENEEEAMAEAESFMSYGMEVGNDEGIFGEYAVFQAEKKE